MNNHFYEFNNSFLRGDEAIFYPNGERSDWSLGCFGMDFIPSNGIGQLDKTFFKYSFLLLIMQIFVTTLTLRFFIFIFRPLRVPRVVAEILTGVILGPSLLGQLHGEYPIYDGTIVEWTVLAYLFPTKSLIVLDTMANVGLFYYLFMMGLEMDISVFARTGQKAIYIAATCIGSAFLISICLNHKFHDSGKIAVLGVSCSITAFPIVARLLTENKLLNTELGRIALPSSLIVDVLSWLAYAFIVPGSVKNPNDNTIEHSPYWIPLNTLTFFLMGIFVLRPGIKSFMKYNPDNLSPLVNLILVGVMGLATILDLLGGHAKFGAFFFGMIIPRGSLTVALIERLEDIVPGVLLPLYFVVTGLRTNISYGNTEDPNRGGDHILGIIMVGFALKILAIFIVACFHQMPVHDGLALGFLMNSKGIIQVIILNSARDLKVLDQHEFSMYMLTTLLITATVSPVVTFIYKSSRGFITYKHRTIQQISKGHVELRVLACVHNTRQAPGIIRLLEISQPTQDTALGVYALNLVELTGRSSAMLIVNHTGKSGYGEVTGNETQYEQIINLFQNYEERSKAVYVEALTTISAYSSIHEDICNLAEENRTGLIILPFHKHQTVDGGMEITNQAFRSINQNVLANAPCSVGILVDRGISKITRRDDYSHYIAMLYFGGPDDREALSYARRMADRSDISLTVIRFLPGNAITEQTASNDSYNLRVVTDTDREKGVDDEFVRKFRMKSMGNDSIVYTETIVNNVNETVQTIKLIDSVYDLYIVGRGQGMVGELTAGLVDWCECPELGGIGDLLATSDFRHMSVLVVQRYAGAYLGDGLSTPSSDQSSAIHLQM